MSDGISFKPTDGDKRADVFRRLADAESDASRAARQLDTYERMVINQRDAVAQADELCNTLRKECAALLSHLDGADAPTEPHAPAQPLDELRSVTPATKEDRGDHILQTIATLNAMDNPDRVSSLIDAQTCEEVNPRVEWASDEPEIPEGFTKWEGGVCPVDQNVVVRILYRDGVYEDHPAGDVSWSNHGFGEDVAAYRILEAPAPEQPASVEIEQEADIQYLNKPTTDLWQQGYDDKANGYDPSLAEPEYTKGYEARALIEREHRETMERAKFFDGGMMADADRHQSDQRGIVDRIAGMFKREREDA